MNGTAWAVSEGDLQILPLRFADRANRVSAHEQAVAALGEGLNLAARLPADDQDRVVLDLLLRRAFSLSVLGRFQEIRDSLVSEQARLEGAPAGSAPRAVTVRRAGLMITFTRGTLVEPGHW